MSFHKSYEKTTQNAMLQDFRWKGKHHVVTNDACAKATRHAHLARQAVSECQSFPDSVNKR